MEAVPVVLATGDRVQFGESVAAPNAAKRRVAAAPRLASSEVALAYRYEDTSFP